MRAVCTTTASMREGPTGATGKPLAIFGNCSPITVHVRTTEHLRKIRSRDMKAGITITLTLSILLVIGGPAGTKVTLAQNAQIKQKVAAYYCVMDPGVRSNKPGKCRKCGMDL